MPLFPTIPSSPVQPASLRETIRGLSMKLLFLLAFLPLAGCDGGSPAVEAEPDPPEIQVGERLFLETRFARFFFDHAAGHWNEPLLAGGGDAVMDETRTTADPLEGPFAGRSMNCRACHLVDEHADSDGGGFRTYSDFATRSPVPARDDGQVETPRNSPSLVNASLPRATALLLHFDGEFATIADLVAGTLTGRNYGWLAGERGAAVAHVANVLREDDGSDDLAAGFGALSYRVLLGGTDDRIPDELRIPEAYRIDVASADDEELLAAVSQLIAAYVEGLVFTQNDDGEFSASPYDVFLEKNGLPRTPLLGESDLDYSRRLLHALYERAPLKFVEGDGRKFRHDRRPFVFGRDELRGLLVFLSEANDDVIAGTGGVGNCVSCHAAPNFTDFSFHNTGVSQKDYDAVHGEASFAALAIPEFAERNADPAAWLPPSEDHPSASGRFRAFPSANAPGYADLGLWNVLGNAAIPGPQASLLETLCANPDFEGLDCNAPALLSHTIAYFKTPGLRDLAESGPYMHDGASGSLGDVLQHYIDFAALARDDKVRNPSKALAGIDINEGDAVHLVAFLRALDEDYE